MSQTLSGYLEDKTEFTGRAAAVSLALAAAAARVRLLGNKGSGKSFRAKQSVKGVAGSNIGTPSESILLRRIDVCCLAATCACWWW